MSPLRMKLELLGGRMTPWPLARASILIVGTLFLLAAGQRRESILGDFHVRNRNVPYSFGACGSDAMDCSCFVQKLYRQVFQHQIPRTTLTQEEWLKPHRVAGIGSKEDLRESVLCPGDLIYTYQGDSWEEGPRHVVVYQGGGRILHSSKSRGRVGTDGVVWLRKFKFRGVYRPLGCGADELEPRGGRVTSRIAEQAQMDDRAVRRLIYNYFRSLETRNLGDYRRLWSPRAQQGSEGRLLDFTGILRERRRQIHGLRQASARYQLESLAVFADQAFVEVRVSLDLLYGRHRRQEENVRESFILAKQDGQWRLAYSDDSIGN